MLGRNSSISVVRTRTHKNIHRSISSSLHNSGCAKSDQDHYTPLPYCAIPQKSTPNIRIIKIQKIQDDGLHPSSAQVFSML